VAAHLPLTEPRGRSVTLTLVGGSEAVAGGRTLEFEPSSN
jgi:hypothetical protein